MIGLAAAIASFTFGISSASAGVIETLDFEDAAGTGLVGQAPAVPLAGFYQSQYGVVFGNASLQNFDKQLTSTGGFLAAGIALRYMYPYVEPPYVNYGPIFIDLNFDAASVSILAFRNWQPSLNHHVTMSAYNAIGDILGTDTFSATTLGPFGSAIYWVPLTVTANDIRSVQLEGDNVGLGVVFDNLTITSMPTPEPIPEPVTLWLFGTGLAGVIAMRRRKKKT